jgi:hypothetical protein
MISFHINAKYLFLSSTFFLTVTMGPHGAPLLIVHTTRPYRTTSGGCPRGLTKSLFKHIGKPLRMAIPAGTIWP